MVTLDGYTVMQKKNKVEIYLPQTMETVTSTATGYGNRKPWLSSKEEAIVLCVVKKLMEEEDE